MHTSVDDLEFFLQITKSLDHLRGEGGGGREVEDTISGSSISPLVPMKNKNGGTLC